MQQPMVSVIVPVYKVEKYLTDCIDSILNQTYGDFELILVDDGSPDKCPEICDTYAGKDSRVRVIHKPNGGVSSARNTGICVAQGKYITFVDSDDIVEQVFFQNAVHDIEQSKADLYICGLVMETWDQGVMMNRVEYTIQENATYSIKMLFEKLEVSYPQICICGPWCKLYKREIVEKEKLRFDETMNLGEDTFFNLHYYAHCSTVMFSHSIFYHYRRENTNSLFSRLHRDTLEIHTKIYDKMYQDMVVRGCSEDSMRWYERLYATLLIGCIHAFFRNQEQTSRKEQLEVIQKVSKHPIIGMVRPEQFDIRTGLAIRMLQRKQIALLWCMFFGWYSWADRRKRK